MNIIKKIVRRLGFDIVRFSTPLFPKNGVNHRRDNPAEDIPVIPAHIGTKALKSVGRRLDIPVFTYYERPASSSVPMDEAENLWWNAHGKLIDKVWVLSEAVNGHYRKGYVSEAVSFFKNENRKIKILDLGCGSGWFGRMIADGSIEYHGMDFSSTQIEIANREKEGSPNKNSLNYYCLSDFKKIENLNEITGVVLHAFLHHLYWDELHHLFGELVNVLPDGCKFFILEPVYPDPKDQLPGSGPALAPLNNVIEGYRKYIQSKKRDLINNNLYDTKTEDDLNNVIAESGRNGFFFSPKEVPFRLNEFTVFLSKYLYVESMFHSGVLDIETAQFVEKITSKEQQDHYAGLLFPLVKSMDRFLIANNYFEANPNNYLFTAFKCVLNKGINGSN